MTYEDALTYLDSLTNFERRHDPQAMQAVRLERMHLLCERLGRPQRLFRAILVAGTNGKGSICAMLYAILRAANLRVGLYTSPHLHEVRERIQVGGASGSDWIGPQPFADIIERLRAVLQEHEGSWPGGPPTYFEVLTAAAFLHFARSHVQLAVLEVGLGGRLDATNIVDPVVSVLGPVGLDHTDVLGEDLVTIAGEKAGVIRPDRPVVSAAQDPSVSTLIRQLTDGRVLEYGEQFSAEVLAHETQGLRLSIRGLRGTYPDLRLPLVGRHQAQNAAVAVAAVEALSAVGVPHEPVRRGLACVQWPGRIEVMQAQPWIVLDGAHNPQAAHALRATLEELWPGRRLHLLIGMSHDKPIQAVGGVLAPLAASITCTKSRHQRSCDAQRLAQEFAPTHPAVSVIPDVIDAVMYLANTIPPDEVIVVTGSLFLVGETRVALRQAHTQAQAARDARAPELQEAACPS